MKLSVNINKIATIRNDRVGNNPNLIQVAIDCERFGADGITVHPRPDQRHIRFEDVRALKKVLSKEFNIEGNPSEKTFVDLVMETRPTQVTLVPDASNQLTSNHGWDTVQNRDFLKETVQLFSEAGMRVSIFVDPISEMIIGAKEVGAHRIELYTEAYARTFLSDPHNAREPYVQAAFKAAELGVEVNAGMIWTCIMYLFLRLVFQILRKYLLVTHSFATPYIWGSKIPSRCIKDVCNRGNLHYFYRS